MAEIVVPVTNLPHASLKPERNFHAFNCGQDCSPCI